MTTTPDPTVERAAARLVDALTDVAAIEGFRRGLAATIHNTEIHANPADPAHFEALDALTVWRAFADLVAAVQTHRKDLR